MITSPKLSLITLVLLLAASVNAQQMEKPEYLTPFESGISIKKVVTDDKSTTLYFTAECDSADRMHIPSAFKLSDEEGRLYSVTGCEGIILDSTYVFNEKKNVNFCLSFQPLPATCKVFDCTDACNRYGFPAFYAIHDSGTNLSECEFGKATEDATQRNTRQEKVLHKAYKTGIAKLSVSISPADKLPTASRIEVILPHHWGKSYDFNEKYAKCIGKLQHDGSVNYDALSALFQNFCRNQPFLPLHQLPRDATEDYYMRADAEYNALHELCDYIAAKHHYSDIEKRLLSAHCDMFITYKYLYSVTPKLPGNEALPSCNFLSKIAVNDPYIFSVPSFTAAMLRLLDYYDKVFPSSANTDSFLRQCSLLTPNADPKQFNNPFLRKLAKN